MMKKRITALCLLLKKRHWDEVPTSWTHGDMRFFGIARPPIRLFWDRHKKLITSLLLWLGGVIGAALILRILNLG